MNSVREYNPWHSRSGHTRPAPPGLVRWNASEQAWPRTTSAPDQAKDVTAGTKREAIAEPAPGAAPVSGSGQTAARVAPDSGECTRLIIAEQVKQTIRRIPPSGRATATRQSSQAAD